MPAKLTIENAHSLAESRGYKFLSSEFKNVHTKHLWKCGKGHSWNISYSHVQRGIGCPECSGLLRKTINDARNLAEIRGFKFLSNEFKNASTKHLWECSQSHKWMASYDSIKQGTGCPQCSNKIPKTIQDAHELAISKGFKFLSIEFKNANTKHLWQCGNGHFWNTTYSKVKQGRGCRECSGLLPKTITDACNLAEIRGFKFLSSEFKNASTKHLWECSQSHKWMASYDRIKQGTGCPHCSNKIPKTIQDAHQLAISKGFKFLSGKFKNTSTKHLWECSQSHKWMATYSGIKQGTGCPHCSGLISKTIEDAHNLAQIKGLKFLSLEFKSTKIDYLWGCNKGHTWNARYNNVRLYIGCPVCCDKLKGEKLTRYCFEKILQCDFKKIKPDWMRNPQTNSKLELDGFNEKMCVAFEHQGIQHEIDCPKDNLYYNPEQFYKDEIKRQKCKEQGITLIEVPEIGLRLKINDVVPFLLSEFDKHNIAYPESAKNFQIDMKEFYAEYMN
jgi:hypothetical protein